MPDNLKHELHEALAQARSFFEDLRDLGVTSVPVAELPAELPVCPAEVCGVDRGGTAVCRAETLSEIQADLGDCQRCPLCHGRKNIAFGVGNPHARVVFVGGAPGREEDLSGEPFVGEAGLLLDRILYAMGLSREDVYLCYAQKCKLSGRRDPLPEESAACEPFLKRQLAAIEPEIIVSLGRVATQTLLGEQVDIRQRRGTWHQYQEIPLLPTYDPAYLLRTSAAKREVWDDMKQVIKRLRKARSG